MNQVLSSLIYVIASCLVLYVSEILFVKIAKFSPGVEIKKSNHTATIAFCGYLIGVVFILAGAFIGPSAKTFKLDLIMYLLYAFVGLILMAFSVFLANKVMLYKFDNAKELLEDNNIGTAAVHFSIYVSSGLIIAACVNGEYGGLLSTIGYYLMDMIFLFIFIKIYDLITPYDVYAELEKDNYAVGIALAGNIIAIGLILMKATLGNGHSWQHGLILYFVDLASIILLLPSARFVLGHFIVKSVNINTEIQKNNVAASLIEFIFITSFALIIFFMVDFTCLKCLV